MQISSIQNNTCKTQISSILSSITGPFFSNCNAKYVTKNMNPTNAESTLIYKLIEQGMKGSKRLNNQIYPQHLT